MIHHHCYYQAVLHLHPYHIDTLLQLSEVCRMSEDPQMAAELIGTSVNPSILSSVTIGIISGAFFSLVTRLVTI